MMHRYGSSLVLLAALTALIACNASTTARVTPAVAPEPTATAAADPLLRFPAGAAVNPFRAVAARPTINDLADARHMDAVQQLVDDGLYDQARAQLDGLLGGGFAHPVAFMLKAQLTEQAGDTEAAIPWYDRAIAASPLWFEPRIRLADVFVRLKRLSAADAIFVDIDRLAPQAPWGPYGRGVIAAMSGDAASATKLLDEALARDPQHQPSLETRASLARQAGDTEREATLLNRYIALTPDAGWAYARLGELAAGANRPNDAAQLLTRAYELDPDPATARRLADLAQARGDDPDAARWRRLAGIAAAPAEAPPAPAR